MSMSGHPAAAASPVSSRGSPVSESSGRVGLAQGRGVSRTHSECASVGALETLDFPNKALLRGTSVADMLRDRARVLGNQPCTEQQYTLSARVDHIDAFISHNWSVSRGEKFLALALHFNLFPAAFVASAISLSAFALTIAGVLPSSHQLSCDKVHPAGVWCQLFGMMAFLLALFYWHEVRGLFPGRGQVVFLDKTCVHQTDMELKRQGIERLPAFLSYSWSMVVLYSDTYLQKLWTVYELATFLLLFLGGQLHVQPVLFPKFVLAGMLLICFSRMILAVYHHPTTVATVELVNWPLDPVLILNFLVFLPPMIGLAMACRWWAREFDNIHRHVNAFSITKASCLEERDRRIVESNVATFARHVGFVSATTAKGEALASFDALVQREVPYLLKASLGRVGVPYRHAVMIFAIYFPYTLDVIAAFVLEGKANAQAVFGSLLWCVSLCFGVGPLCVALCFWLTRSSLRFVSCTTRLLCLCCIVLTTAVAYCVHLCGVANTLFSGSMDSALGIALFFSFDAALVLIAVVVFGRPRLTAVNRRIVDSDSDDGPMTEDECSSSGNDERCTCLNGL